MLIRLEQVTHEYPRTEDSAGVRALDGVSFEIASGDFAILMGPSGSGKSTLLHVIGAVERPTSGRVFLGNREITALDETALTTVRRTSIGFIFQFFNLIPTLTVRENIGFPLALAGAPKSQIAERTAAILEDIGLAPRAGHYPNQLSGGEMQRVAIGRAIVHRPPLIIADEPTGNLDTQTGQRILEAIRDVHRAYHPTIVMATHSNQAASFGDYVLEVVDGNVHLPKAAPAT